jgi:hypothetical protein
LVVLLHSSLQAAQHTENILTSNYKYIQNKL